MPAIVQRTAFSQPYVFIGLSVALHMTLLFLWQPRLPAPHPDKVLTVISVRMKQNSIEQKTSTANQSQQASAQLQTEPQTDPSKNPSPTLSKPSQSLQTERQPPQISKQALDLKLDHPLEFLQPTGSGDKSTVFSPGMKKRIEKHRDLFAVSEQLKNETRPEPDLADVFGRRRVVIDGRCWLIPNELDDIKTGFPLVAQDLSCQQVENKEELEQLVKRVLGQPDPW